MSFNPLQAVGTVLGRLPSQDRPAFLGSCFALRDSAAVVTAAHCIGDLSADQLLVAVPHIIVLGSGGVGVSDVIRHPEADVAILRLRIAEWTIEPFWNALPIHGLGEDFFAYGFPENVLSSTEKHPTPRLFKGYVQRVFRHESHMGFSYWALELDFACPAGLSGGPLYRPGAPQMVLGLATENFESTTFLDATEETTQEGGRVRTEYQRVLSYGVAVELEPLQEWLDEHLPRFNSSAYVERTRVRGDK